MISGVLLMFISLLQGQEQCSASEQSLDCRNDLDEEKALSAYLNHISKIQGVDRQAVVKVREILWDFIDYRKGPQDELTKLNRKESRASKSYQSILDEYYHAETLSKGKEQLLQNYTNRNQEFFQEAKDHYKKLAEYKILGNYQEAAAKIQQAMGPIEAPEKDRMRVENGVTVFRVAEKISGEAERRRLRQQFTASDFTPTGFYLPPNIELRIDVKREKGTHLPNLVIDTYGRHGFYCPTSKENKIIKCNSRGENEANNAREIKLGEGENIISTLSHKVCKKKSGN